MCEALQVITGIPPIPLLIKERKRLYDGGRGRERYELERTTTIDEWQRSWENLEERGQWTKRLIPDIRIWTKCKHRNLNYWLTQFISGHGSFGTYTYKIKKTPDDKCRYCKRTDTPEHTILHCPRWNSKRQKWFTQVEEEIQLENIIGIMMKSRTNWKVIHNCINEIMSQKELEERREQQRDNR